MTEQEITKVHPDYKRWSEAWTRCRDATEGEDAIKDRGESYLPALDKQTQSDYKKYKTRAMFYAAAGRTMEALVGSILRKDPLVEWPGTDDDLKFIGASNDSFKEVTQSVLEEVIGIGRAGLLIDAALGDDSPYLALYYAENITNWREAVVKGRRVPSLVVLKERIGVRGNDEPVFAYRRLMLSYPTRMTDGEEQTYPDDYTYLKALGVSDTEIESGFFYFQELWEPDPDNEEKYVRVSVTIPRMKGGRLLQYIPFIFLNPGGQRVKPEKPPMLDQVNVNLSHYRNSADLEHGRHWTALPTAWAAGFDTDTPLVVGSSVAWVTKNEGAKASYLEFTGQGLGHLAEGMRDKEKLMAILGARLLEEQKNSPEAAEAIRLRHAGEASVLSRIAMSVGDGLGSALEFIAQWGNLDSSSVNVVLNKDYTVRTIDANQLTSLVNAVASGVMSWPTFFWNLQQGEVIPDTTDQESEAALIMEGPPGAPNLLGKDDPVADDDKKDDEDVDE